jgi:pyruvate formate lyase activating enzyme
MSRCRIPEGGRGGCAVRYNVGGRLYTLVYDRVVARPAGVGMGGT